MTLHRVVCLHPDCGFQLIASPELVERAAADHSGQSRRKGARRPGHAVVTNVVGADDDVTDKDD